MAQISAGPLGAKMVVHITRNWFKFSSSLRTMVAIVICTALLAAGVVSATAQQHPKPLPTTHSEPSDSPPPKPTPAAGEHVKPNHQESSGPDCFGADKNDPICGPARPTPDKPKPPYIPPMNLVWDSVDLTGWPMNPKWEWQTQPGNAGKAAPAVDLCGKFHVNISWSPISLTLDLGHPPCTNTPLKTDSDSGIGYDIGSEFGLCESSISGSQNGHVNWMPVTYTGTLSYESHDDAVGHDGDYNLQLVTPDSAGLTSGETHFMKVEFKDSETVDRFVTPFWTSGDFPGMRGKYAIVTGVLGLDGVHDFDSELHPAYLVAIRTRDPDSPTGASYPERWAFFVRNWGNEGMCSHFIWQASPKVWIFKLPWRPSAKSVRVEESVFARNDGTYYDIRPLADDGIIVAVGLGDPGDKNVAHGEIALYWDETGAAARKVIPPQPHHPSIGGRTVTEDAAEQRLTRIMARVPAESRARFTAAVGARAIVPGKDEKKAARRTIAVSVPTGSIWTGPARQTLLQTVEDTAEIERKKRLGNALCEAYRNNIPEYPKLCQRR